MRHLCDQYGRDYLTIQGEADVFHRHQQDRDLNKLELEYDARRKQVLARKNVGVSSESNRSADLFVPLGKTAAGRMVIPGTRQARLVHNEGVYWGPAVFLT